MPDINPFGTEGTPEERGEVLMEGFEKAWGGRPDGGSRFIAYNLNDYVYVRLTDEGRVVHTRHYERLGMDAPEIEEDEQGWTKYQLWELMQVFGEALIGTSAIDFPFGATIRLEAKRARFAIGRENP